MALSEDPTACSQEGSGESGEKQVHYEGFPFSIFLCTDSFNVAIFTELEVL